MGRINLDGHDVRFIELLYAEGIITICEALSAKCACDMKEADRLVWIRKVKSSRSPDPSLADNPKRLNHTRWVG